MNFIVVVDENYGIGCEGKLLTHVPGDLNYFKEKTLNKVIVMGRKTLKSLPGGKTLPYRTTVVLTKDAQFQQEGVTVIHSIEELLEFCKAYPKENVFICGGAEIYHQLIPFCQYGYITKLHSTFSADTYLDKVEDLPNWQKVWESEVKEHKGLRYTFTKYENLGKSL